MSLEQKIIELDHRIIVLNNKLNELNQSLHVTDVDVNTLDERVSDVEESLRDNMCNMDTRIDTLHWSINNLKKDTNTVRENKYNMALQCLREIYSHCRLHYAKAMYEGQKPIKRLEAIGDFIVKELNKMGEPLE